MYLPFLTDSFYIVKTFTITFVKVLTLECHLITDHVLYLSFQGPLIPAAFTNGYHWKCHSTNILRKYTIF